MTYKQVLSPNLDNNPKNPLYIWIGGQILTDWCGWCLAVVAGSFGAKGSSYSAKTAWQSCNTKHVDRNLPEKVWIPLWYEGGQYGHVVLGYREGNNLTVYSSPYTHKATFDVFKGELNYILNYVGQVYAVGGFSGWSESVLDSYVVSKVEETKPSTKPEPKPEPTPEPEPEPEPIEDNNGKDNMSEPTDDTKPIEPANPIDQQLVGGIIEEASSGFEFSDTVKLIAYLVGDAFLVGAILVPDIVNTIQAPNLSIFGEYLAKVLLEAGICILMVFKLIKKKS